jgi:hypothetical protein
MNGLSDLSAFEYRYFRRFHYNSVIFNLSILLPSAAGIFKALHFVTV